MLRGPPSYNGIKALNHEVGYHYVDNSINRHFNALKAKPRSITEHARVVTHRETEKHG